MTFDLGDNKQVIVSAGHLKLWAFGGKLGVDLTPELQEAIGLAMFQTGRKERRERR
jgi:hypothetical protein